MTVNNTFYTNVNTVKNKVLFRGYDVSGNRVQYKVDYKPTVYVPTNDPSDFQTLDGKFVSPITPGTIKDTRNFVKKYSKVDNFKIYGNYNPHYCFIRTEYPGTIEYKASLIRIANIDIETGTEGGFADPENPWQPITAISMKLNNKFHVFGCYVYKPKSDDVIYYHCEDERDLILQFLKLWEELDPDIVTGWNVQLYDIPYIINRVTKLFDENSANRLSPWREITYRRSIVHGKENDVMNIVGIPIMDYMELYKKFTYTHQESYRLDHIAHIELGERKISYDEVRSLQELHDTNFEKFIDYNIKDVEIVSNLENKMKLLEMALALAYSAKVNYNDVFSQVRMWDTMIHNHLLDRNIVIPEKPNNTKTGQYAGAYVKEPIVGMHEWIVSFDLESLYPSLIRQINISPEMLIDQKLDVKVDDLVSKSVSLPLEEHNVSLAANGCMFKKDRPGFLSAIMSELHEERRTLKTKMLKAKQYLDIVETEIKKRGIEKTEDEVNGSV